MKIYKMDEIRGIIFNSIDSKESNEIVNVYTEEGFESVYLYNAKDFSKGKLAFLMPFTYLKFTSYGSSFKKLKSYEIIENFDYIKEDYNKSLYAYAILFLLKSPHDEKYDKRIFDFVIKTFSLMKTKNPKDVYLLFLTKMTYVFGGKPNLDSCVVCGDKNIIDFSIIDGGFLCSKHRKNSHQLKNGLVFKELYNYNFNDEYSYEFDNNSYFEFITSYYQKLSLANLYSVKKMLQ